ncbi:hypothetical protein N7456_002931 [Penicillium angulare]|uniref:AB hydrolase-1 domain-containing protein n=1 Tax=Penicillium angulare TaxID=116970 RepID=A0A9W9FTN3_9EURO|nr:hypothetical protein N7456_002931 [Penicillium angulare]
MSDSDPSSIISNISFHRRTTLETKHGLLTVSFADIGCPTGPVLLYLPGMFASRYLGIPMHTLAIRAGIRLLVVDRPGMGCSTDVPLAERIDAWIDILPRLLSYLNIQRVSLASHSAGTIYLLNTWERCPELVTPNIFFMAPWVDIAHSQMTSMQMLQYIPEKAFSLWHHIPRFFVKKASPVLASSGTLLRSIAPSTSEEEDRTFLDANWRRLERDYGVPRKEAAELTNLVAQYMFTENTVGANSEALQCVRKGDGGNWGVCSDYAVCARRLVERAQLEGHGASGARIWAYHATKDAMVGSRGPKYFDGCWDVAVSGSKSSFESRTVEGTDHDTVCQAVEVWEEILSAVSG